MTGLHPRTIERYVDAEHIPGVAGQPAHPPARNRWVHVEDVVQMAVDRDRGDQVPAHWRDLIPAQRSTAA
jgi:hypothetical protein